MYDEHGYVRPGRDDDDHGPEMLAAVICLGVAVIMCGVVAVAVYVGVRWGWWS